MSDDTTELTGPDLSKGVALSDIPDGGTLAGHALGKPVLLARSGDVVVAVGAACTHYGGSLGDGLVVDGTVRCPLHHACFSLRTGEALRAPALNPLPRFVIEQRDGRVLVTRQIEAPDGATPLPDESRPAIVPPGSIVIVGAGAAGNAAAELLRRLGYDGPLTMIGADEAPPCDRPNLSKDYLAGNAPEEWIPLRPPDFYAQHGIDLRLGVTVRAIDLTRRSVHTTDGTDLPFDRLLLATGADPVRLSIPGVDLPHVHYLRTLSDSRAIVAGAAGAQRAVVIGAGFIGLEVAASLRARGLEVAVVAPEFVPLERVLGRPVGTFVRQVHEGHGVVFHLGDTATVIEPSSVRLRSGAALAADLVVIGVGVQPNVSLATGAGLAVNGGVVVNEFLETSVPGIFAAGDVARWPDPHSGERIRVEHWVVAERQGQTAARNMLGVRERHDAVPFFWSAHFDTTIRYVGHATRWDAIDIDGNLAAGSAAVRYLRDGRTVAAATVGRDLESLNAEVRLERGA